MVPSSAQDITPSAACQLGSAVTTSQTTRGRELLVMSRFSYQPSEDSRSPSCLLNCLSCRNALSCRQDVDSPVKTRTVALTSEKDVRSMWSSRPGLVHFDPYVFLLNTRVHVFTFQRSMSAWLDEEILEPSREGFGTLADLQTARGVLQRPCPILHLSLGQWSIQMTDLHHTHDTPPCRDPLPSCRSSESSHNVISSLGLTHSH